MGAEQSLVDIAKQAELDVTNETGEETTPAPEVSQETPEDKELAELDKDTEFAKEKVELEKEQGRPLSFSQTKRFRTLYRNWREAQRKQEEMQSQLDELSTQAPEMTEQDLMEYAQQKGYKLTRQEKAEGAVNMPRLQEFLNSFQEDTPGQRKFLENFANAILKERDETFAKNYEPKLKKMETFMTRQEIKDSEDQAKKFIEKLNKDKKIAIDYDKDIDPEIANIIHNARGTINPQNADFLQMTYQVLATKGIDLGRQLSVKEQQQLNEAKKKANAETQGAMAPPSKDYNSMSIKEIMKATAKEMGHELG